MRWIPGAALLLLIGQWGCYAPNAVVPIRNSKWTLDHSEYPPSTERIEIEFAPGQYLRGIYVPSDPRAPLVVHFAEAGGSIVSSFHLRGQYQDFAERGFASLAIDYRGVGQSDGEACSQQLGKDAQVIYERALQLVDGDRSCLILRGCSLGTLASASLIDSSQPAPAAIIWIAPVRAETVAWRYGYANFTDLWITLARPFLSPIVDVDLLSSIASANCPLLVLGHPEDELLGSKDWKRIRQAVERAGGQWEEPATLGFSIQGIPDTQTITNHISIAQRSFGINDEEVDWLKELFPQAPNIEYRLKSRLHRMAPEIRRDVVSQKDVLALLRAYLESRFFDHPNVLGAAALNRLEPDLVQAVLDHERRFPIKLSRSRFENRSPQELLHLLDLGDPEGRLPNPLAAFVMGNYRVDKDIRIYEDWPIEDIVALSHAACGLYDGDAVKKGLDHELGTKSRLFCLDSKGRVFCKVEGRSGIAGLRYLRDQLETDTELAPLSHLRRWFRIFAKAAGHVERVVNDPDGSIHVEVHQENEWTRILLTQEGYVPLTSPNQ